jgi:hypothetical protein
LVGVNDPAADAPHNSRIMQQLDIQTTADLTNYAITHGITGLYPDR